MDRTVNLWEYLPGYLLNFREFRELLDAEQPEFETLFDQIEKMRNNLFIVSADANGLKKYAKLVKYQPEIDDTLDDQRARILSRWTNQVPYTLKSLEDKIRVIQGNNDFSVIDDGQFNLFVLVSVTQVGRLNEIKQLLDEMIPMNISIDLTNGTSGGTEFYCATAISGETFCASAVARAY